MCCCRPGAAVLQSAAQAASSTRRLPAAHRSLICRPACCCRAAGAAARLSPNTGRRLGQQLFHFTTLHCLYIIQLHTPLPCRLEPLFYTYRKEPLCLCVRYDGALLLFTKSTESRYACVLKRMRDYKEV